MNYTMKIAEVSVSVGKVRSVVSLSIENGVCTHCKRAIRIGDALTHACSENPPRIEPAQPALFDASPDESRGKKRRKR